MDILVYLIPLALLLGGLGLAAFLWSLKSGLYEDLEGAKWRILNDDDLPPCVHEAGSEKAHKPGPS